MKWSSAGSDNQSLGEAVRECSAGIRDELGEQAPDLVIAFVSAHHSEGYERVPELVKEQMGDCTLIGCSSGGGPRRSACATNGLDAELATCCARVGLLPSTAAPPPVWRPRTPSPSMDDSAQP